MLPSLLAVAAAISSTAVGVAAQHEGHGSTPMNPTDPGMGGGDSGHSMTMTMVFFSATDTPLFFSGWKPKNAGEYTATCLFLVALTIAYRALTAYKARLEHAWMSRARARRYVHVGDRYADADGDGDVDGNGEAEAGARTDAEAGQAGRKRAGVLTVNGVRSDVRLLENFKPGIQAWRWSVDLPRAVVTLVITAVGYLLMLAVMTMNVGYFFSVLAGAFVGELGLGRFGGSTDHHDH